MQKPGYYNRLQNLLAALLVLTLAVCSTTLQGARITSSAERAHERALLKNLWEAYDGQGWSHTWPVSETSGEDLLHCTWHGVGCCLPLTASPSVPMGFRQGYFLMFMSPPQEPWEEPLAPVPTIFLCDVIGSVAALTLQDEGLVGPLDLNLFTNFLDLQALVVANNPGLVGGGSALIDFSTNTLQLLDVRNTSMSCSASDLSAISPNTSCSLPEGFKATAIIKEGTDRRLPVHCAVTLSKSQPNTLMRKDIMADPRFWHYSSCSCEKNWDGGSITLPASLVTVDGQLQPHCAPKGRAQLSGGAIAGIVVGSVVGFVGVLAAMLLLRQRLAPPVDCSEGGSKAKLALLQLAPKRTFAPGTRPDLLSSEVTLACTDVEGSTALWEWDPEVMNRALAMHDALMRATVAACGGYEVTTEGDAFLIAWHTPVEAARWSMLLQLALLELDWPAALLTHPLCCPRPKDTSQPSQPSAGLTMHADIALPSHGHTWESSPRPCVSKTWTLFKGLGVRMGMATGVPSVIREHPVTHRMAYTGQVLRMATAVCDAGGGGGCLLDPVTFRGIHASLDSLDLLAPDVTLIAALVNGQFRGSVGPAHHTHANLGSPGSALSVRANESSAQAHASLTSTLSSGRYPGQQSMARASQGSTRTHVRKLSWANPAKGPPLAISGSTERASLAMAATSLLTHARTSNPPHSPSNSQYRSRADLGAEGVPQPRVVELYQKASSVAVVAAPQPKGGLAFATSRDRARSRLNLELGMGSDGTSSETLSTENPSGACGTAPQHAATATSAGTTIAGRTRSVGVPPSTPVLPLDHPPAAAAPFPGTANLTAVGQEAVGRGAMGQGSKIPKSSSQASGLSSDHGRRGSDAAGALAQQLMGTASGDASDMATSFSNPGMGGRAASQDSLWADIPKAGVASFQQGQNQAEKLTATLQAGLASLTHISSSITTDMAPHHPPHLALSPRGLPCSSDAMSSQSSIPSLSVPTGCPIPSSSITFAPPPLLQLSHQARTSRTSPATAPSASSPPQTSRTSFDALSMNGLPVPAPALDSVVDAAIAATLGVWRQQGGAGPPLPASLLSPRVMSGSMGRLGTRSASLSLAWGPCSGGSTPLRKVSISGELGALVSTPLSKRVGSGRLARYSMGQVPGSRFGGTVGGTSDSFWEFVKRARSANGPPAAPEPFSDAQEAPKVAGDDANAASTLHDRLAAAQAAAVLHVGRMPPNPGPAHAHHMLPADRMIDDISIAADAAGDVHLPAWLQRPTLVAALKSSTHPASGSLSEGLSHVSASVKLLQAQLGWDSSLGTSSGQGGSTAIHDCTLQAVEESPSWTLFEAPPAAPQPTPDTTAGTPRPSPTAPWQQPGTPSRVAAAAAGTAVCDGAQTGEGSGAGGNHGSSSSQRASRPEAPASASPLWQEGGGYMIPAVTEAPRSLGSLETKSQPKSTVSWVASSDLLRRKSALQHNQGMGASPSIDLMVKNMAAFEEDALRAALDSRTGTMGSVPSSVAAQPTERSHISQWLVMRDEDIESLEEDEAAMMDGASAAHTLGSCTDRGSISTIQPDSAPPILTSAAVSARRTSLPAPSQPSSGTNPPPGGVRATESARHAALDSAAHSIAATPEHGSQHVPPSPPPPPPHVTLNMSPQPTPPPPHSSSRTPATTPMTSSNTAGLAVTASAPSAILQGVTSWIASAWHPKTRSEHKASAAAALGLTRACSLGGVSVAQRQASMLNLMGYRGVDGVVGIGPNDPGSMRDRITACVIDLGVHRLSTGDASQDCGGCQIVMVLPTVLQSRAVLMPAIKSEAQLLPSFFDAPAARLALQPRPAHQAPLFPPVTLMFISPSKLDSLYSKLDLDLVDATISLFCAVVRSVLTGTGCYECQEFEGAMMIASSTPRAAAQAALQLQVRLLEADWPPQLAGVDTTREEVDEETGGIIHRGLRAKVGIYQGVPLSVVPHATTGRADYFGTLVNRAARLMAGAQGGQILMDTHSASEVAAEWRAQAGGRLAAAAAHAADAAAGSEPVAGASASVSQHGGGRGTRDAGAAVSTSNLSRATQDTLSRSHTDRERLSAWMVGPVRRTSGVSLQRVVSSANLIHSGVGFTTLAHPTQFLIGQCATLSLYDGGSGPFALPVVACPGASSDALNGMGTGASAPPPQRPTEVTPVAHRQGSFPASSIRSTLAASRGSAMSLAASDALGVAVTSRGTAATSACGSLPPASTDTMSRLSTEGKPTAPHGAAAAHASLFGSMQCHSLLLRELSGAHKVPVGASGEGATASPVEHISVGGEDLGCEDKGGPSAGPQPQLHHPQAQQPQAQQQRVQRGSEAGPSQGTGAGGGQGAQGLRQGGRGSLGPSGRSSAAHPCEALPALTHTVGRARTAAHEDGGTGAQEGVRGRHVSMGVKASHAGTDPLHLHQPPAPKAEGVMFIDMGDYALKGVAHPMAVMGLQLARLQGRRYPLKMGSGKTVCVRTGKGVVEVVEACLFD